MHDMRWHFSLKFNHQFEISIQYLSGKVKPPDLLVTKYSNAPCKVFKTNSVAKLCEVNTIT